MLVGLDIKGITEEQLQNMLEDLSGPKHAPPRCQSTVLNPGVANYIGVQEPTSSQRTVPEHAEQLMFKLDMPRSRSPPRYTSSKPGVGHQIPYSYTMVIRTC